MPHRDIREFDAKRLIAASMRRSLSQHAPPDERFVAVSPDTDLDQLRRAEPWLSTARLVVKPDMLFGTRGKLGLIKLDVDFADAARWIAERREQEVEIAGRKGRLTHFVIEPFVPHEREYYFAVTSERDHDRVLFSAHGGVEIEKDWERKVRELRIPVGEELDHERTVGLVEDAAAADREHLAAYLPALYRIFQSAGFAYLEVNPLTFVDGRLVLLDTVAKVDDTSPLSCRREWGWAEYPSAFGANRTPEEEFIRQLDEKTGASLKFTLLNPDGRVWLLISGGGASVIYADTVVDLGFGEQLANYGEYSGNPSTDETWDYARTVLSLMNATKHKDGKVLIIGGGIANFTDTAKTFQGIIRALEECQEILREGGVRIFVRRGGPNYKRALEQMAACGQRIGVPVEVHGPEAHMTEVVAQAARSL